MTVASGKRDDPLVGALAVGGVLIGFSLGLWLFGQVLLAAALFVPLLGIPLVIALVAGMVLLVQACLRGAGRPAGATPVAIVAALVALCAEVALLYSDVELVMGTGLRALDLKPVLSAAQGAAVVALWLGRWWLKSLGALVVVATIAAFAIPAIVEHVEEQNRAEEQKQQMLADALASYAPAVTAELPGASIFSLSPDAYGSSILLVTVDGGTMRISTTTSAPDQPNDSYPCWIMAPEAAPTSGYFDPATTLDDYARVCSKVGDRWNLDDGSALTLSHEGVLVTLARMADTDAHAWDLPRGATPAELLDAAEHLRTLSKAEVKQQLDKAGR